MKKLFFMATACAMVLAGCTKPLQHEDFQSPKDYRDFTQASENVYYPLQTVQQAVQDVLSTRGAYAPRLLPTSRYIAFYPKTPGSSIS